MEVAASKGLPALKYHLLPRTKGFTTAVQCLRGTGKGLGPPKLGVGGTPGFRVPCEARTKTVKNHTSELHAKYRPGKGEPSKWG